ncbi:hypothetical protein BC834DRAFT_865643 [Gloeopeniophorella convolvens]|nr:hypothetical protein BC834DRAFT_865643 [Gloeopeniophorella convolvens]
MRKASDVATHRLPFVARTSLGKVAGSDMRQNSRTPRTKNTSKRTRFGRPRTIARLAAIRKETRRA